jgi:phenylalanyl-tRNA synthetase beta chain
MPWHPGRCAELIVDGAVVGHAGELHPRVLGAYGLPPRSAVMELDLRAVLAAATPVRLDGSLSGYPVAKEDVALVVGSAVAAADVAAALRAGAGELLESARLFDVYTGEQVGPGHKSLAYALRFRAPDRTLTVDEVSAARDAAVAAASAAVGAALRT